MSEQDIVRAILVAINGLTRATLWRSPSGTASGGRRRMAPQGTPDLTGYLAPSGRFVGLEVKKPGEKPSVCQLEAGRAILAAGGIWAVVTSVEEAMVAVRGA
jgi:hypothetical protein